MLNNFTVANMVRAPSLSLSWQLVNAFCTQIWTNYLSKM